jgi:hypothetical protein
MTQADVLEQLVEECRDDHVGLWELMHAAQLDLGASDPEETCRMTLELARRLLNQPGMLVGFPAPDGRNFIPWKLTPDEAFSRIEREWKALGREPSIGDIAWFTTAD